MITSTLFLPGLSPVASKSLTVSRDAGNLTSNGGLIVLREVARTLDIAVRIAKHIPDTRNPLLLTHTHADMVLARAMMIAAGHEDCDDIDTLKSDPAFKIACDRAPESGVDLMSQPTLSRLENAPDAMALYAIGCELIDVFLDSYAKPPKDIVLDIDDTDDLVRHGGAMLRMDAEPCCAWTRPAVGPVQYARGWSLFSADPHLRGQLRQAGRDDLARGQAPVRQRDCARALACHPPHPRPLAQSWNTRARRRTLRRARSVEFAASFALRLHFGSAAQQGPRSDVRALES